MKNNKNQSMLNYKAEMVKGLDNKLVASRMRELFGDVPYRQLEEKTGISKTTLNKIANGKGGLQLETIYRLATFFDVSIDYLCGRKEY